MQLLDIEEIIHIDNLQENLINSDRKNADYFSKISQNCYVKEKNTDDIEKLINSDPLWMGFPPNYK